MKEKTTSVKTRNSLLLVLTALIWGVAFVAQSEGGNALGPYTFCVLRYLIGGIVLLPVIRILDRAGLSGNRPTNKEERKHLAAGGVSCGLVLAVASVLQQVGLYIGTPAGKAGFLTACYIVLVPVFGLFLKKKCGFHVWISVAITVIGLYFLCIDGSFSVEKSDLLVIACSAVYAVQILLIDHYVSKNVDPVRMSCIQFFTATTVSLIPMFFIEMHGSFVSVPSILSALCSREALLPLLYTGIMSSGVAYTLQIVGQKDVNPAVASLLMSLESVFSVLAGWIILHQILSVRELLGCLLIFIAVVLAQLPVNKVIKRKRNVKTN